MGNLIDASAVMRGATAASAVYKGSALVWSPSSPATAPFVVGGTASPSTVYQVGLTADLHASTLAGDLVVLVTNYNPPPGATTVNAPDGFTRIATAQGIHTTGMLDVFLGSVSAPQAAAGELDFSMDAARSLCWAALTVRGGAYAGNILVGVNYTSSSAICPPISVSEGALSVGIIGIGNRLPASNLTVFPDADVIAAPNDQSGARVIALATNADEAAGNSSAVGLFSNYAYNRAISLEIAPA